MHPSDPPIACTDTRITAIYDRCQDLLTSQQATEVTTLIADLKRERDAGLLAFCEIVDAGQGFLDAMNRDSEEISSADQAAAGRFVELIGAAQRGKAT